MEDIFKKRKQGCTISLDYNFGLSQLNQDNWLKVSAINLSLNLHLVMCLHVPITAPPCTVQFYVSSKQSEPVTLH